MRGSPYTLAAYEAAEKIGSTPSIERKRVATVERYGHLGAEFINLFYDQVINSGFSKYTSNGYLKKFDCFLKFLSNEMADVSIRVKMRLYKSEFKDITLDDAHAVEQLYASQLYKTYGKRSHITISRIWDINRILHLMSEARLWPFTIKIVPSKKAISKPKSRNSLLELLTNNLCPDIGHIENESDKYAAIKAALHFLGIELRDNPDFIVADIISGEKECLRRIRNELSIRIENCFKTRQHALSLIQVCTEGDIALLHSFFKTYIHSDEKYSYAKQFIDAKYLFRESPKRLNNYLFALQLFLFSGNDSYIHQCSAEKYLEIANYLRNVRLRYLKNEINSSFPTNLGNSADLKNFFHPSSTLVAYIALLLMSETNANESTVMSLQEDMIKHDEEPGWLSIAAWKDRANGKLINDIVYVSKDNELISSGRAIQKLIAFHKEANYHKVFKQFKSKIFYAYQEPCGSIAVNAVPAAMCTNKTLTSCFDSVCKSALGPEISMSPSSMRVSLLTIERSSERGLTAASIKAGHANIDTTYRHYSGKFGKVFKIESEASIRNFQKSFEQIALKNLNNDSFLDDVTHQLAVRTGLGSLCLKKPKPETGEETCYQFEHCTGCAYFSISTDPNDLAQLLAFSQYLQDHKDEILLVRGDAWENRWIYWTQLAQEVLEVGPRKPWAKNLMLAKEILSSASISNQFPRIW